MCTQNFIKYSALYNLLAADLERPIYYLGVEDKDKPFINISGIKEVEHIDM